jgi:hypothetical protein
MDNETPIGPAELTDVERTTAIEERRDSYRPFFDWHWGRELRQLTDQTKLRDATVDLIRNWQAASQLRTWPDVMTKMAEHSLRRGLDEIAPILPRKVGYICDNLVNRLEQMGEKHRPAFWRKLKVAIAELDERATKAANTAKEQTIAGLPDAWLDLIQLDIFHNMVWNSERTCYASLYFNYECFLKECVRIKRGIDRFRVDGNFGREFKSDFDETLTQLCWRDEDVNIARLARLCLAHNGGKITPELAALPHPFMVEDGELQIAATMTTVLYLSLKERVTTLVQTAVSMPEFAVTPT